MAWHRGLPQTHGAAFDLSFRCIDRRIADVASGEGHPPAGGHIVSRGGSTAGAVLFGSAWAEQHRHRLWKSGTGGQLFHHHAGGLGLYRLCHRQ